MFPDDRVLVAYMPDPADFARLCREGWYRLPFARAPKGRHAEYFAFYFGRKFGTEKYAIHYFARQRGHELVRRRDLMPAELDHPRADRWYYKVQFGPLQRLSRPIMSLNWRRITFIHTTWDRLIRATEIRDLILQGDGYVNRRDTALRERPGAYHTVRIAPPSTINVAPVI